MVEIGKTIRLEISEPWPIYKVLIGTIVRSLNSGHYYVIRDHESSDLYIVASRHEGERLSDIEKGGRVIVGIATPLPGFDLMAIPEIIADDFRRLNYSYIGSMEKVTSSSD